MHGGRRWLHAHSMLSFVVQLVGIIAVVVRYNYYSVCLMFATDLRKLQKWGIVMPFPCEVEPAPRQESIVVEHI